MKTKINVPMDAGLKDEVLDAAEFLHHTPVYGERVTTVASIVREGLRRELKRLKRDYLESGDRWPKGARKARVGAPGRLEGE